MPLTWHFIAFLGLQLKFSAFGTSAILTKITNSSVLSIFFLNKSLEVFFVCLFLFFCFLFKFHPYFLLTDGMAVFYALGGLHGNTSDECIVGNTHWFPWVPPCVSSLLTGKWHCGEACLWLTAGGGSSCAGILWRAERCPSLGAGDWSFSQNNP